MNGPASLVGTIAAEGGLVSFARFMELALTYPTLGYYNRADKLLGHGGDFDTAPGLSPFFNRTVARLVTQLVDASLEALVPAVPLSVVELGGGEGQAAAALLEFWEEERPRWREKIAYRIVDVGPRLRRRQAAALAGSRAAGWSVGWGGTIGEAAAGTRPVVVVGNEFLDTLPVHLLRVEGGAMSEAYVQVEPPALRRSWGPVTPEAAAELDLLFGPSDPLRLQALTEDGVIEVVPALTGLIREVARVMPSGSLVNLDYGEWFPGVRHSDEQRWGLEELARRRKTIRGYFKHRTVDDLLARPGGQDLTADVDFAALDLHGRELGFETVVFTTLSAFLRVGGAEAGLEALQEEGPRGRPDSVLEVDDVLEADRQATVLRNLLDERDLGGAFKLMVQVRE